MDTRERQCRRNRVCATPLASHPPISTKMSNRQSIEIKETTLSRSVSVAHQTTASYCRSPTLRRHIVACVA